MKVARFVRSERSGGWAALQARDPDAELVEKRYAVLLRTLERTRGTSKGR